MILAYAKLMRVPLVFSVVADILLGGLVVFPEAIDATTLLELVLLTGASACLYLTGMVFNDVFDVEQDTRERPWRPIPSGAVGLRAAVALGVVLMSFGISLAWLASQDACLVSIGLAGLILIYDRYKAWRLAPLVMGMCRGVNVLLGSTLVWPMSTPDDVAVIMCVALAMTLFITGVTVLARTEASGIAHWQIATCRACYRSACIALWIAFLVQQGPPGLSFASEQAITTISRWIIVLGAGMLAFRLDTWYSQRMLAIKQSENQPLFIGRTVGQLLSCYPLLAALTLVTLRPEMWPAAVVIVVLRWGIVWGKKYVPIT